MTTAVRPRKRALRGAPASRARLELLALGLISACLLAELALLRVGIDDLDEGYFAQQALRVLAGQVPFRDFETFYAPGLAYLHASVFALSGGPNLLGLRALALAARAALAFSTYAVARPLVRNPLWAALPGVFLLVGLDDAPERWEPHPGWLSTLFAVLAASALNRGVRTTTRVSSTPSPGAARPITRTRRARTTQLVPHVPTSTRLPALVVAGALAALSFAFKQNTGLFILAAIVLVTHKRSLPALASFAVVTAVWLVPLAMAVGDPRALAPLVGAVNQAGLGSPPEPSILIPLGCVAAGVWLARGGDGGLRWTLLAGLALFATQYPRMDTLHLAWSAPLLLALGAAALERLNPALAVASLLGAGILVAPLVQARAAYVSQPRETVADVEAPARTARDLQRVLDDIASNTAPGEPIFVYPSSPLLYALSGRRNPTRFDHLNPGAATPAQIQNAVADLQTAHVRLVVISDFWQAAWGPSGDNAPLEDFLASHFVKAAQHGAYQVLAPRL